MRFRLVVTCVSVFVAVMLTMYHASALDFRTHEAADRAAISYPSPASTAAPKRNLVASDAACDCPWQGDIDADGCIDVFDLIAVTGIAFSGYTDIQDPECPTTRGDVNNIDGYADVFDVIQMIGIAFSGANPSDPCNPAHSVASSRTAASAYQLTPTQLTSQPLSLAPVSTMLPSNASMVASVVVESKNVARNDSGVTIGVFLTNDVAIKHYVIPLELRSTNGGAFVTNMKRSFPTGTRLDGKLTHISFSNLHDGDAVGTCKNGQPGGYTGIINQTLDQFYPVIASPEAVFFTRGHLFNDYALPAGTDGTNPQILLTVDINNNGGTFEIDTTCTDPCNHLIFVKASDNTGIVPAFTKGVITVGTPPPYRFVHLSDIHIGEKGAIGRFETDVARINEMIPRPAFVVISGDLVGTSGGETTAEQFHQFKKAATMLEVPWYTCPGNHDQYYGSGLWCNKCSEQLYVDTIRPDLDYIVSPPNTALKLISMNSGCNVGGCDCVVLGPQGSGISDPQYNWLDDQLQASAGFPRVLFLHHPIVYCSQKLACNDGWACGKECISSNRARVWQLLQHPDPNGDGSDAVKLVLSGHTHAAAEYKSDSYTPPQLSPQTGTGWWSTADNAGSLPLHITTPSLVDQNAFRLVKINGDDFRISPVRTFEPIVFVQADWSQTSVGVRLTTAAGSDTLPPSGRMHVRDSLGNHVGVNDAGQLDFAIPGSCYRELVNYDDTTGRFWVAGEVMSIPSTAGPLTIAFHADSVATLNLEMARTGADSNLSYVNYSDIQVTPGGHGHIQTYADSAGYTLYWDDNGDSIPDRLIPPDCSCRLQGDINGDAVIDVFDVIDVIGIAFSGAADVQDPGCPTTRGDVDNNGVADVFDVIYLIATAFSGGANPVNPCGP